LSRVLLSTSVSHTKLSRGAMVQVYGWCLQFRQRKADTTEVAA
jgi:hypothetical protein